MKTPFIDAHVHLNTLSSEKLEMAAGTGVKFVSINTDVPDFVDIDAQQHIARTLYFAYPDLVRYAVTFRMEGWEEPGWADQVIYRVQAAVSEGAVGVKIWKNLGMEVKDKQGNFLLIDDERLDPLFDYFESHEILVLGHQGEPRNCWLPLDKMTVNSDREYFSKHPEYHMFLHPEFPSYEKQIGARDNRLRKNPGLKYVGLHLMSLEYDVREVAKRLDEFPNSMTDLAERICHLQYQAMSDHERVKEFLIDYQDRIMYGTDVIDDGSRSDISARFRDLWERHWKFLATDEIQRAPEFDGEFRGLALPEEVLNKIMLSNAARIYGF